MRSSCFICSEKKFFQKNDYKVCLNCGHQILNQKVYQTYIENEILDLKKITKTTSLDKFKNHCIETQLTLNNRKFLLDVGSSGGKLLYDNKNNFEKTMGVEVTSSALKFSRDVLKEDVVESIDDVDPGVSFVTAFHSLEHFPADRLSHFMQNLSLKIANKTIMIISVPSAASIQYRVLGKNFAFYDVPNHIQQFTERSLEELMSKFGFKLTHSIDSWIYNLFGWVQGLSNVLSKKKNYLYYRLKRGKSSDGIWSDSSSILITTIVLIPAIILFFAELIFISRKGVITKCFIKES